MCLRMVREHRVIALEQQHRILPMGNITRCTRENEVTRTRHSAFTHW